MSSVSQFMPACRVEAIAPNEMDAAISKTTAKKYKMLTKVAIYSCELVRQVSSLAAAIIGAVVGTAAACFGSAVTATVLAFTGLMTAGVAGLQSADLLKDAKLKAGKVQTAKQELELDQCTNEIASPKLKAAFEESQNASTIATLGFVNNCLFFGMGIGRITTCVVTILERLERVAHLVVFSAGAATAFVALHAVASVVYFARGAFLAIHAEKNLTLINAFEKEWNDLPTIDKKIAFLKKAEDLGQDYVDLRLDRKCLGGMTAKNCINDEDKTQLVNLVNKAIYSHKLKHQFGGNSGKLMMAASILAAATLCVATGGIAFFILSAASAFLFAIAEVHFIMYYHPGVFEKVRDKIYIPKADVREKPVQVPVSVEDLDSLKVKKPRETCCPNLGSYVKSTYDRLGWAYTKLSGAVRPEELAS